ncbi:MAG: aminotransferase class I/II-fold pyridoxal phosphate-dependent enzyme [Eubacterium sp.]|nr:aminotransferase class I/II-fold pyridoxal phosphate-dependent enzyme [Eubacterium sp.]
MSYKSMSSEELNAELENLKREYQGICEENITLNMARGKPGADQLELSMPMLDVINSSSDITSVDGVDCRNYGVLDGVPEAKKLMADMMNTDPNNVIVFGNASLNIMHDNIARAYTHGVNGSTPWCKLDTVKWLCPVPGYDRHFKITEHFGFEMINIPMDENGPDMDMVEELVANDDSIKGIWCVPKYSNPTGTSYSDEVVKRFANLRPKANDFRIYWDNAYAIHHLYDEADSQDEILSILDECEKAGNPNLVYEFCSTSKITFPGAGIAALGTSKENKDYIIKMMQVQTIGHDKINQLRHAWFFKDFGGLKSHMQKHGELIRAKFETVLNVLEEELAPCEIATWTKPNGGYFISLNVENGCAKKVVNMCKEAGLVLTGAGATYPYGNDPDDSNIRIAPTYVTAEELKEATHILAVCTKIATLEK